MRRKTSVKIDRAHNATITTAPADGKPADGAFQAMDQIANWVRFADTKGTVLTAGLGVAVAGLLNKVDVVIAAMRLPRHPDAIEWLAILSLISSTWTLLWLTRLIAPRRTTAAELNRFAWPALTQTTGADLVDHGAANDVREDAWEQVANLSTIAHRKYRAFSRAGWGFAVFIASAAALVIASTVAVAKP